MAPGAGTSSAALPGRVRRAGLGLAVAGLVAGAVVYLAAAPVRPADADPYTRQRVAFQIERLGGRATVRAAQFDQWLSSLWHGRRLGVTLAVLGVLLGGACWRVGVLMGEDD